MDHLKVKWLSFIHIIEVLNGDDQAQLQDGQTWRETAHLDSSDHG